MNPQPLLRDISWSSIVNYQYPTTTDPDPDQDPDPTIWHELPSDIRNIVLEYQGYHKNRTGRYIRQLENVRRRPLHNLPTIVRYLPSLINLNRDWGYEVNFVKTIGTKTYKNTIRTVVFDDHVTWIMTAYALAPLNYMHRGRMMWKEPQVKTEQFVVYK
jgi:hypothetical protein